MGWFILTLLLLTSLIFILLREEPIAIGLGVARYSTIGALLLGVEYSRYYGYLLFFVYVGTLVVIFCMVVAIAPNPQFKYDVPLWGIAFFWVLDLFNLIISGTSNKTGNDKTITNLHIEEVDGSIFGILGRFRGTEWGYTIIALAVILLLAVVSVVNISKRLAGPLVNFKTE